jgi:hypothetical protein
MAAGNSARSVSSISVSDAAKIAATKNRLEF